MNEKVEGKSITKKVPILVYHHVYPNGHPELSNVGTNNATGVIQLSEFRRHIAYIVAEGWEVISTSNLVDWLHESAVLPNRSIVLHFDNGWLDTYQIVMPVLREFGINATCYIISDPTSAASEGRPASIRTSTEGVVHKPFLTWDNAKEMLDLGWEIGAHTATHPKLGEIHSTEGVKGVVSEIETSNYAYERGLGFKPKHFAYPSGSRNEITDSILAQYYQSLRRWNFSKPQSWTLTDSETSPLSLECQNIDSTVDYKDFTRIFHETGY